MGLSISKVWLLEKAIQDVGMAYYLVKSSG